MTTIENKMDEHGLPIVGKGVDYSRVCILMLFHLILFVVMKSISTLCLTIRSRFPVTSSDCFFGVPFYSPFSSIALHPLTLSPLPYLHHPPPPPLVTLSLPVLPPPPSPVTPPPTCITPHPPPPVTLPLPASPSQSLPPTVGQCAGAQENDVHSQQIHH